MAKKSTVAVTGPVVQMVAGAKVNFRANSARAVYYARFAAFDGKALADLEKDVAAAPPSVPSKGKLAGKQEPFAGWVAWFHRHGYVNLVNQG